MDLTPTSRAIWHILVVLYGLTVHASLSADQHTALIDACPGYDDCFQTPIGSSCCMPCSCDRSVCLANGNCCPNVAMNESTVQNADSKSESLAMKCVATNVNLGGIKKKLSSHERSSSNSHLGVTMVATCVLEINESRCTNADVTILDQSIPVYNMHNGVTYRNIFCVQCNKITTDNTSTLLPWRSYITCSNRILLKSDAILFPNSVQKIYTYVAKTDYQSCGIEFLPPENITVQQDLCFDSANVVNDCRKQIPNQPTNDSCGEFHMPYISMQENETIVYSNYFCYLCNNEDIEDENQCALDIGLLILADNDLVAELNTDKRDASLIMSPWLQSDLTHTSLIPAGVKCEEQFTFDPYLENCREWSCPDGKERVNSYCVPTFDDVIKDVHIETCRQWYCPDGRERVNSDCVPTFADVIKATYSVSLTFTPDRLSLDSFNSLNKTILTRAILSEMFGKDNDINTDIVIMSIKQDISYMYLFILVSVDRNSSSKSRLFDQTTYANDITLFTDSGNITVRVDFSRGIKIELSTYPFSDIVMLDMVDYTALVNLYRLDINGIENAFKYTHISKMTFCSQVVLHASEIRDYVDILKILMSDEHIYIGEFSRTASNDQTRVCLSDYLRDAGKHIKNKNNAILYTPQGIVSVVCNFLSILGLLVTIMTYIIFEELRSIPGKNNMMLSVHLLIAQCLYQFGIGETSSPKICIALGMLIHLFWLTAIYWMNACTLHMFRTFVTGQSYRSARAIDPQVCGYALYCYGIAISMVAINIGVSMYRSEGKDIGYGGQMCYISNAAMVGWVFALPVGVVIVLNMSFFFAVVYQISASTMRRRGKSTDRANTVIYMKLSSLTGVTWIFGFLYIWTDFGPLEYIFIVLNAGQGVFIFISFICTQRILKKYGNLFRKQCMSYRENHTCVSFLCACKLEDSEGNAVELNTAKISLTAGSSKRFTVTREPKLNTDTTNGKGTIDSSLGSNTNCQSTTNDIFQSSAKIAHELCNPISVADRALTQRDSNTDLANQNGVGAISDGLQNEVQSMTIAAISFHNMQFGPKKRGE